jgi:hypothetical protein
MAFDYKKISNVVVSDIDHKDFPDFTDAFIDSADYDGLPMTEEQLNVLNDDKDYIYECIMEQIY